MKIKAAIVKKNGDLFVIEELDLAEPRPDELLVKVTACGVCHTDDSARHQRLPAALPAVLGHEGCGVVERVGADVREFRPGDRVTFSFGYCGVCENCLTGNPARCDENPAINFENRHPDFMGRITQNGQPVNAFFAQGSFATHAIVKERGAVRVPDDFPLELAGPLGCGIQTGAGAVLNRLCPRPGSSLVVQGCGSVGLSALMAAKIAGCGTIIGVDVVDSRLETARALGATHVINSKATPDVPAEVRKIVTPGVNCAVDTTGVGGCLRVALNCTRTGGTTVVVGSAGDATINVQLDLMGAARSLLGVIEGDSVPKLFIPKLMDFYRRGLLPYDKFVTFYDFKDINEAFHDTHSGKTIKAILRMG